MLKNIILQVQKTFFKPSPSFEQKKVKGLKGPTGVY